MRLDASLFAVLRLLNILVRAGHTPHPREVNWLTWVQSRYEFTDAQREIIQTDSKNPPRLADVFHDIREADDRQRLLDWARISISIDEKIDASEDAIYLELLALNEQARRPRPTYADELIELSNRQAFWDELRGMGEYFRRHPRRRWYSRAWSTPPPNAKAWWGILLFPFLAVAVVGVIALATKCR
jgi:hypothetical protein